MKIVASKSPIVVILAKDANCLDKHWICIYKITSVFKLLVFNTCEFHQSFLVIFFNHIFKQYLFP